MFNCTRKGLVPCNNCVLISGVLNPAHTPLAERSSTTLLSLPALERQGFLENSDEPVAFKSQDLQALDGYLLKRAQTFSAVDLPLDDLSHFLKQFSISPSGQVFILEANGLMVASSGDQQTDIRSQEQMQRLSVSASRDPLIPAAAKQLPALQGLAAQDLAAQDLAASQALLTPQRLPISKQQFEFALDGQRQFVQIEPWRDVSGLDWLIVAIVPASDFPIQTNQTMRTSLILCGLALLTALGTSLLTTHWLTQPLLQLNDMAKEIARGKFDRIVTSYPTREVAELAQSVNSIVT